MTAHRRIFIPAIALLIIASNITLAQSNALRSRVEQIVDRAQGRVGAAVINTNNGDTLTVRGNNQFPMQSVFKFPLALAVLHQVDLGVLSLDKKIHVAKADLLPDTWSPLREKYPNGNVDLPLEEIITATVAQSDNNGCDILFRLIGGPAGVERYVRTLGISQMAFAANEEEMHAEWNVQYRNWSSPYAMAALFSTFYHDSILSAKSTDFLWRVMVNTVTGAKRLKGKLPEGTIVGHKTGSSGSNAAGMTAATNDAGIVMLPGNVPVVIVVFVADSYANVNDRENVIADIAKAVWDAYASR